MQEHRIRLIDIEKLNLGRDRYLTPAGRILDTMNLLLRCETRSNCPEIKSLKRELWNSIAQELGLGEKFFGSEGVGYNERATEWFRRFDLYYKTHGLFAVFSQKQEYRVFRYSLDYINSDLKLIIEWDEEQHYRDDKLTEKDIERQRKVRRVFRNFAFLRIREKYFDNEQFSILNQRGCKWLKKRPYLEAINKANSNATK